MGGVKVGILLVVESGGIYRLTEAGVFYDGKF